MHGLRPAPTLPSTAGARSTPWAGWSSRSCLLPAFVLVELRSTARCCRCASWRTATGRAPTSSAAGRRRAVRRLPVPDLLPAGDPALHPDPGRVRLPAQSPRSVSSGAGIGSQLTLRRAPVRGPAGLLLAVVGMFWLSRINRAHAPTRHDPVGAAADRGRHGLHLHGHHEHAHVGVGHDDAGVATAVVSTTQQVGGSIGTALLNTMAATAAASYLAAHLSPQHHGRRADCRADPARPGAQLHHRILVGRRHVRRRSRPRRPAVPPRRARRARH